MMKTSKLQDKQRRSHYVAVRFNSEELSKLDEMRQKIRRGTYIRSIIFGKPPKSIPPINVSALYQLSAIGNNVNQIAKALNTYKSCYDLPSLQKEIEDIRKALQDISKKLNGGKR